MALRSVRHSFPAHGVATDGGTRRNHGRAATAERRRHHRAPRRPNCRHRRRRAASPLPPRRDPDLSSQRSRSSCPARRPSSRSRSPPATRSPTWPPGVAISVEGPGTGDGFAQFCAGETDIADASRPISDEEVAGRARRRASSSSSSRSPSTACPSSRRPRTPQSSASRSSTCTRLLGPDAVGINNWADASAAADEFAAHGHRSRCGEHAVPRRSN